jgi:RNA polymerase sigma-70 factor (ECF subfamily)
MALDGNSTAIEPGLLPAAATDLTDEEVVERVKDGHRDLFEILMRRHNQRLYRAVRSILRDEAETEDVLQDAYVRAFTHLDQFLGRARFATWLTRIAVNEALYRQKRGRRLVAIDALAHRLESPAPGPENRASNGELREALGVSIDRLSEDFRTVFVLRDVEGLSTAETAESLAIPEETVKTRLHRARRQLRGHVEEQLRKTIVEQELGKTMREVFAFGSARCDRLVAAVLLRIATTEPPAKARARD